MLFKGLQLSLMYEQKFPYGSAVFIPRIYNIALLCTVETSVTPVIVVF